MQTLHDVRLSVMNPGAPGILLTLALAAAFSASSCGDNLHGRATTAREAMREGMTWRQVLAVTEQRPSVSLQCAGAVTQADPPCHDARVLVAAGLQSYGFELTFGPDGRVQRVGELQYWE
jgi:hypothetical protein